MNNGVALNVEQYAEKYAALSNSELLSELELESSSQDRCCGMEEERDCQNSLTAARAELLKRMTHPAESWEIEIQELACAIEDYVRDRPEEECYEGLKGLIRDFASRLWR